MDDHDETAGAHDKTMDAHDETMDTHDETASARADLEASSDSPVMDVDTTHTTQSASSCESSSNDVHNVVLPDVSQNTLAQTPPTSFANDEKTEPVLPPEVLKNFPTYVQEGEAYFRTVSKSSRVWNSLVNNWLRLEQACTVNSSIAPQKRPAEIGWWLKRHRKLASVPPLKTSHYIGQFREWWKVLQPPNRDMSGSDWPPPRDLPEDSDWSSLCRTGSNGFFIVMMALSWWAHHITSPASVVEFDSMAEDVNWAVRMMLKLVTTNSAKRSHSDLMTDDQEDQSPKKRVTRSS